MQLFVRSAAIQNKAMRGPANLSAGDQDMLNRLQRIAEALHTLRQGDICNVRHLS